jgi:hypothetical protein
MSKPTDIPQDIWNEASRKALEYVEWLIPAPSDYAGSEYVLTQVIARAIMMEREVIVALVGAYYTSAVERDELIHAIRNPSPADPPRAANSSPAALGAASNDDFATIPHLGPVA